MDPASKAGRPAFAVRLTFRPDNGATRLGALGPTQFTLVRLRPRQTGLAVVRPALVVRLRRPSELFGRRPSRPRPRSRQQVRSRLAHKGLPFRPHTQVLTELERYGVRTRMAISMFRRTRQS